MKSSLCQIAQTQQAAAQTTISQVPVRNFPCGSHLLLWKIVAAELRSVRAEKNVFYLFMSLFFFPQPHRVTAPPRHRLREISTAIICCRWRPRRRRGRLAHSVDSWLDHFIIRNLKKRWSGEALRCHNSISARRLWCSVPLFKWRFPRDSLVN